MQVFRFLSPIAAYVLPAESECHQCLLDGLKLSEECTRHDDAGLPVGVKAYRVAIESEVRSLYEVRDVWSRACDLIGDLDRVWVYVIGEPLRPVVSMIRVGDGPEGWLSNFRELESEFAKASSHPLGLVEVINRHWMKMSTPPLRKALSAVSRLRELTGPTQALQDLHYSSLKTTDSNAQLFLLAKCLEIVRHLLPGRNDTQRQAALHPAIQQSLTRSLHELFGLANTRFDVRHAVQQSGPELHPAMSGQERAGFVDSANALVRGILCEHLGLEPFVVRSLKDVASEAATPR